MKTKEQIEFGEQLRRLRLDKGLTQEKLGVLCGLHRNYISSIERGERNVSLTNILKLARSLEIHPAKFFDHVLQAPDHK